MGYNKHYYLALFMSKKYIYIVNKFYGINIIDIFLHNSYLKVTYF